MNNKHNITKVLIVISISTTLGYFTLTTDGGNLNPDAPPAPTMHTLDEIYNGINALSLGSSGLNGPVAGAKVRQKAYVDILNIPGESADPDHVDWIEVLGVNNSAKVPVTSLGASRGGRSRRRAEVADITIIKEIDKSTPKLYLKCLTGGVMPNAFFEFSMINPLSGNTVIYYKIHLKNVTVTGFAPMMSYRINDEYIHIEEVSFNFEEIKWTYIVYDSSDAPDTTVETVWKVESNEP